MAVEANMKSVSISSLIHDSKEPSGDVISPEDWAWVDSCLIQDGEISDSNWISIKDALLEILSDQPENVELVAARSERVPDEYDIEILPSREEVETAELPENTENDLVPSDEIMENVSDDLQINETVHSQTFVGNPFLPNYVDVINETKTNRSGLDLGISISENEPPISDVFKVWDLNFSDEEDEFGKQLNKAFTESSDQSKQSTLDNSGIWKDLEIESIDDLIASVADLSLNQNSNWEPAARV